MLWSSGAILDLGTLGGTYSEALDINDQGQVVGDAFYKANDPRGLRHAFVWQNGKMTDLGTLPGGKQSEAVAINNHGQIVGSSETRSGGTHAVV